MAEAVGSPYNVIPPAMFIGFSGGIQHWGTVCGALVAPVALISGVVADKKIRGQVRRGFRRYSEKSRGNIECLGGYRCVYCCAQTSSQRGELHGMSH